MHIMRIWQYHVDQSIGPTIVAILLLQLISQTHFFSFHLAEVLSIVDYTTILNHLDFVLAGYQFSGLSNEQKIWCALRLSFRSFHF